MWGARYAASGTRQRRAVISSHRPKAGLYLRYEGIPLSVLVIPSGFGEPRGTSFEKRTLPGPLFYLVPRLRETKRRVNESAGRFTKRETDLCYERADHGGRAMPKTATSKSTDRVRRFRERAKQEGWTTVAVKVPASRADDVRAFAETLGEPVKKRNPAQGSLFPDLPDE